MRRRELAGVPAAPRQLADLDLVLTSLPDDSAVRSALLPPDGLLAALPRWAVLVELSTILPRTMRAVVPFVGGRHVHPAARTPGRPATPLSPPASNTPRHARWTPPPSRHTSSRRIGNASIRAKRFAAGCAACLVRMARR